MQVRNILTQHNNQLKSNSNNCYELKKLKVNKVKRFDLQSHKKCNQNQQLITND